MKSYVYRAGKYWPEESPACGKPINENGACALSVGHRGPCIHEKSLIVGGLTPPSVCGERTTDISFGGDYRCEKPKDHEGIEHEAQRVGGTTYRWRATPRQCVRCGEFASHFEDGAGMVCGRASCAIRSSEATCAEQDEYGRRCIHAVGHEIPHAATTDAASFWMRGYEAPPRRVRCWCCARDVPEDTTMGSGSSTQCKDTDACRLRYGSKSCMLDVKHQGPCVLPRAHKGPCALRTNEARSPELVIPLSCLRDWLMLRAEAHFKNATEYAKTCGLECRAVAFETDPKGIVWQIANASQQPDVHASNEAQALTVSDHIRAAVALMRGAKRGEVQASIKVDGGWAELTLPEHRDRADLRTNNAMAALEADRGKLIVEHAAACMRLYELSAALPEVEKLACKTPRKDERAKVEAAKARVEPLRAEIRSLGHHCDDMHVRLETMGAYGACFDSADATDDVPSPSVPT